MPLYNEVPHRSLAGLQAVHESLQELGGLDCFDLFVLSDTSDPDVWVDEELAWAGMRLRTAAAGGGVYYRRRLRNVARKTGNISEFLERWGGRYEYLVILDADSVLSGETLMQMVRRMDADPSLGILQVPPLPVHRSSFFARVQEFAASVYGPVYNTGTALWSQEDSNYWGHNAILRVRPFVEHCGLPKLPGRAPLGGEILSHDFVEAALMRRAGWKAVIAYDLEGSYEECPATLIDYAKRNRRWCEGNLQHLRLVLLDGFHPVSRVHLGVGAMAYLTSMLWLLFLVLSFARAAGLPLARHPIWPPWSSGGLPAGVGFPGGSGALLLFGVTLALLLLPKLWGYLLVCRDPERRACHGGWFRAGLGVLLETVVSVLLAPILMVFNTLFVLSTFSGRSIPWTAQRRAESSPALGEAVRTYGLQSLLGLAALVVVALVAPGLFWWMLPVTFGLALAVPLSMLLDSVATGLRLRDWGLLLIPAETAPPPLLQRKLSLARIQEEAFAARPLPDRFLLVVLDPALLRLHLELLRASGQLREHDEEAEALQQLVLVRGPRHLRRHIKLDLLADEQALRWLHLRGWSFWPLLLLEEVAAARPDLALPGEAPWGPMGEIIPAR